MGAIGIRPKPALHACVCVCVCVCMCVCVCAGARVYTALTLSSSRGAVGSWASVSEAVACTAQFAYGRRSSPHSSAQVLSLLAVLVQKHKY